jgi:hypothetical protein
MSFPYHPAAHCVRCSTDGELVVALISRHLVRLLKTAPTLQVLDAATVAIQELLRKYHNAKGLPPLSAEQQQQLLQAAGQAQGGRGSRETTPAGGEPNHLFLALAPEVQVGTGCIGLRNTKPLVKPIDPWTPACPAPRVERLHLLGMLDPGTLQMMPRFAFSLQAIVRPYLGSKYEIRGVPKREPGTQYARGMPFRRWLFLWLSQLVCNHAKGECHRAMLAAVLPAVAS